MIWAVAILTMVVGSVLALTQTDIKRMLAYSSIAHAGFILVGVARARPRRPRRASLFYLLAYGFTTIGAFAVVTLVRDSRAARRPTCRSGPAWASARRCVAGGVRAVPARASPASR